MAPVPGMVPKKTNSQLGGTGPDADGGKERSEFEKQRREANAGGKDRPPIYKPQSQIKKNSLGPGAVLKGSSAVHGMLPRY